MIIERFEPNSERDLYLMEVSSGIMSRLTLDPSLDADAAWSPDGRRIAFSSNREGQTRLYEKDLATGKETLLLKMDEGIVLDDWTRDGKFIVFRNYGRAVYALSMQGERKPRLLVDTPYSEDESRVSPDGRWIAFNSNESGTWEAYIASFPDFTNKRRISIAGGVQPQWRGDSNEVFYLSPDGRMMSVEIRTGSTLETGVPVPLFQTSLVPNDAVHQYCVTGDGQRFLFVEPVPGSPEPIQVILNWTAALQQ